MRTLLYALLLLMPCSAFALEYHGESTIYEDTVWQGEILIDGILTIAMGATLEIRPGTRVKFVFRDTNADGIGESELFAQGHFVAKGTADRPIIFTSAQAHPAPGDWGALNMMMSEESENIVEHAVVEYAYRGFHSHYSKAWLYASTFRFNQRGAQFQESTVRIDDCSFEHNFNGIQFRDSTVDIQNSRIIANHWGLRAVFVELTLSNSLIEANRTNGISLRDSKLHLQDSRIVDNRRGIYLQRSRGDITGNRIANNREHGIYLEESIADIEGNLILGNGRSGLKVLDSGGRVKDNRIEQSGEFSFYNAGKEDFEVGPNWYGTSAKAATLMDGHNREGAGLVKMAPPLTQQPEVGSL